MPVTSVSQGLRPGRTQVCPQPTRASALGKEGKGLGGQRHIQQPPAPGWIWGLGHLTARGCEQSSRLTSVQSEPTDSNLRSD